MSSSKLNTRLSTERSIVSGSSKFKVKHRPSIAAVTSQVHKLGSTNLLNPTPLWALAELLKVSCSTQSWNPRLVFAPAQNLQCSTFQLFFNWIWEFLTLRNGQPRRIPFLESPSSSPENCTWMGRESPGLKLQCKGIAFLKRSLDRKIFYRKGCKDLTNNHKTTKDKEMCSENAILPKKSYCRCRKGWARLSNLFHAHPGFKKPDVRETLSATILSRRQLDDRFKRIEDPIARRQRDLVMAGYPKKAKWAIVRKSRNPILKMCKNPFSMFQIQFYCMRALLQVVQNGTRSSWLNCALLDDEAVYWVSIGR